MVGKEKEGMRLILGLLVGLTGKTTTYLVDSVLDTIGKISLAFLKN